MLAFEAEITSIYEADLRSATRRALQIHAQRPVVLEADLKLTEWKPKTGKVDVAIPAAKATTFDLAVELKWWKSGAKAAETLWDAWKLASAYRESRAAFTYLIAGGSTAAWSGGSPLLALWQDGTWNSREWWTAHTKLWKPWVTPTAGPILLPGGIKTRLIDAVPIHVPRGEPWELRAVRVTTTPGAAWPFPSELCP